MDKTRILRTTVLLAGIYFIGEFLLRGAWPETLNSLGELDKDVFNLDRDFFDEITPIFTDVLKVIGLFVVGVGLVNIFMVHSHRIIRLKPNWEHSVVLFVGFFTVMIFAVLKWTGPQPPPGQPHVGAGALFDTVITKIMVHMNSTIYSFLAFFVTSAALRAFRVRGFESGVMMVSAVIVLVAMTPETAFPLLSGAREWIDTYVNTAVFRALQFGMILGGITVAMRMWLGIERSAMFKAS